MFTRGLGKTAGELRETRHRARGTPREHSFELLALGVGELLRQHVAGAHALGEACGRLRVSGDDGR